MIARKGDEVLLVRHRHRGWEIPGGHLDPGERWDHCLARELREEGSATVLRAGSGTWVAHGSGSADREMCDARGRVSVPPEDPAYLIRRVWLTPEEEQGYYYGFSNEGMWPLCHIADTRPVFREAD